MKGDEDLSLRRPSVPVVFERLDEKMRQEFTCLGEASLKGKSGGIPIYGAFSV